MVLPRLRGHLAEGGSLARSSQVTHSSSERLPAADYVAQNESEATAKKAVDQEVD